MAVAACVLFAGLLAGGWWALRRWRARPTPIERKRQKLLKHIEAAESEIEYIRRIDRQVENPVLKEAMNTNARRARNVVIGCKAELELLAAEETEERLKGIEGTD